MDGQEIPGFWQETKGKNSVPAKDWQYRVKFAGLSAGCAGFLTHFPSFLFVGFNMSEFKIQKGIPLNRPQVNPEAKLREASKMYEQYFLNEMVKAMRSTVDHSSLTEPSMAEKIYSEKLDDQYVETWSARGGVGLADIIYNQIHEKFFNAGSGMRQLKPQGPLQIQKGTTIKIDETHAPNVGGIPIVKPQSSLPRNQVSFLYSFIEGNSNFRPELNSDFRPELKTVTNPYDGEVLQLFRSGEDRQVVKLAHEDNLVSTIVFEGQLSGVSKGERIAAGQKLGTLSPYASGLTWQLAQNIV